MNAIAALSQAYEKSATGALTAKAASWRSENARLRSGVLPTDDDFAVKEKPPTRRPRKKKEGVANGNAENGAPADPHAANVDEAAPLPDQSPARKPRRRKILVVDTASANETPANPAREIAVASPENVLPAESQPALHEPAPV